MTPKRADIFFTDNPIYEQEPLQESFIEHLEYSLVKDKTTVRPQDSYIALAMTIRDHMIRNWLRTQHEYHIQDLKKVYYLSMEFLMGRLLGNIMMNMGVYEDCFRIMQDLGFDLEEIREIEPDMGLGNGGLGRLAACFLDSMATLQLPATGYGIRYEFGIFRQVIENGYQMEEPDNWMRFGNPWEIVRPEHLYRIKFKGRVVKKKDDKGKIWYDWVDTEDVLALAYDVPIPGYKNNTVNNLRLWQAKATNEFDLHYFNSGDYTAAVESKNLSENISKVLYPNDNFHLGKILRLKQEYFFVSASLQDIIREYKQEHDSFEKFPDKVAVQLNDTHPTIAIPELMRIFLDIEGLEWSDAWDITTRTFAYTNHTVLPEALEKWSLSLFQELLPRHVQIVYEINRRFLDRVKKDFTMNEWKIRKISIIDEEGEKEIRMANLAIVGSHAVNGVSELHTEILKKDIFPDFHEYYKNKFCSITNGITPRRWLLKANPSLAELISSRIGDCWITDLKRLREIEQYADDPEFVKQWRISRLENKNILLSYIKDNFDIKFEPSFMFDVHVKRMHEYKRQLLNVLHVITLYHNLKQNPGADYTPRLVIFSGKAAPGYHKAKLIIKLINSVAEVVNNDPDVADRLKVIFLPNYSVSLAEKIIPASDLSEQVSTAGYEASGTGNMKFALNGALTIGTLDGANIEIREAVGDENIFIFGMTADHVARLKKQGYNSQYYYYTNPALKNVLDMIKNDVFSKNEPGIFREIYDSLVHRGDPFFLLADYESYIRTQERLAKMYQDVDQWTRKSILNVARTGRFSSDLTIQKYAEKIWDVKPVVIEKDPADAPHCK